MKIINEMGVISYFSANCEKAGWSIDDIGTEFPDCLLTYQKTGTKVKAEFEYESMNFIRHQHDSEGCDLIVCWIHDWTCCPLEVLELSDPNWLSYEFRIMDVERRRIVHLESEVERLKAMLRQLNRQLNHYRPSEINEITQRIIDFCQYADEEGFTGFGRLNAPGFIRGE